MPDERNRWLKKLAPGTLLYNINNPSWGFWLVYHVKVQSFPGTWNQLEIHVVDPRNRLTELNIEAGQFQGRWAIVDTNG